MITFPVTPVGVCVCVCASACVELYTRGFGTAISSISRYSLGAPLRGRTTTHTLNKGSEKVLGRVLGKGSQKGS